MNSQKTIDEEELRIPRDDPSEWISSGSVDRLTVLFIWSSVSAETLAASRSVYRALQAQRQLQPELRLLCFDLHEQRSKLSKVLETYKVGAVPTVLAFPAHAHQPSDRVEGVYPARVGALVEQLVHNSAAADTKTVRQRVEKMISEHPILLFMKGTPERPRCGFSQQIVQLLVGDLKLPRASLATFDVLTDEQVRQEVKAYSQWPTFPQLYVRGELIGGLDVCREMAQSGELAALLASATRDEHGTTGP
jgi:Grx4 family monothiol glutaredoxin